MTRPTIVRKPVPKAVCVLALAVAAAVAWPAISTAQGRDPATAATSGPTPIPEQEIYARYRLWVASLPADARGEGLTERYREALKGQGASDADIAEQLRIVEAEGPRLEKARWNQMFTAARPRFNAMPNTFLMKVVEGRATGRALDVGMGAGRNALWLARQGWDVTGFDPAEMAVALAQRNAEALGVPLRAVVASDATFDFGESRWDLIVLSYVGCSQWSQRVERALAPGGLVVVEAFHVDATKDHRIGGSICKTGELPHAFQGLRTVSYEEPVALPDFAQDRMRIVRFAAQKP